MTAVYEGSCSSWIAVLFMCKETGEGRGEKVLSAFKGWGLLYADKTQKTLRDQRMGEIGDAYPIISVTHR